MFVRREQVFLYFITTNTTFSSFGLLQELFGSDLGIHLKDSKFFWEKVSYIATISDP